MKKHFIGILLLLVLVVCFGWFWIWCANELKSEREDFKYYKLTGNAEFIITNDKYITSDLAFRPKKVKALCAKDNLKSEFVRSDITFANNSIDIKDCDKRFNPVFATDFKVLMDDKPTTLFINKSYNDGIGEVFEINNTKSRVKLTKNCNGYDCNYVVLLNQNGRNQVLFEHYFEPGSYIPSLELATVNWAGDIDGDEKLDLLATYAISSKKNLVELYLSSKAKDDEFVGPSRSQEYRKPLSK